MGELGEPGVISIDDPVVRAWIMQALSGEFTNPTLPVASPVLLCSICRYLPRDDTPAVLVLGGVSLCSIHSDYFADRGDRVFREALRHYRRLGDAQAQ